MSEATEIASMGITTMIELMQARDEIKRLKEALDKQQVKDEPAPVAKNEGGRITWMIDDWPQNCLLYTHLPKQEAKDEPVAWKWHQAPVKTSWGDGMVMSYLAIDKDHTVSIYCKRDQTAKVEAMFTPLKRKPLTDEEIEKIAKENYVWLLFRSLSIFDFVKAIEAAHGIKGEA